MRFSKSFFMMLNRKLQASLLVAGALFASTMMPADAQTLAVTFDDGFYPSSAGPQAVTDNQQMLQTLKRHGIKSMLFPTGAALDHPDNRALVKAWGQAGHALGNHTFSHEALSASDTKAYLADIKRAQKMLQSMKGWCARLRFPYLDEGQQPLQHNEVMQWLAQNGYGVASATMAGEDWKFAQQYQDALQQHRTQDAQRLREQYLEHLLAEIRKQRSHWQALLGREPAHVLLLHANHLNATILDDLLNRLKKEGWQFTSATQALTDPIYQRSYTSEPGNNPQALPNPACY